MVITSRARSGKVQSINNSKVKSALLGIVMGLFASGSHANASYATNANYMAKDPTSGMVYIYTNKDGKVLLTDNKEISEVSSKERNERMTNNVKTLYAHLYPDLAPYGDDTPDLASRPNAAIGMTRKQVMHKTNWGKPRKINTTTTSMGNHEQWIYNVGQYLYFHNGVLTAIQQ